VRNPDPCREKSALLWRFHAKKCQFCGPFMGVQEFFSRFSPVQSQGQILCPLFLAESGRRLVEVGGQLTIRGITRDVGLKVDYLGPWATPWWEDGVDKGPKTRAGFLARTMINRHDFDVSWNSTLDKGGVVVGNEVEITIDAEAISERL